MPVHDRWLVHQMPLLALSIILLIPLSTVVTLTCLTTLISKLAPSTAACGPYDHKQKHHWSLQILQRARGVKELNNHGAHHPQSPTHT
ncbi:hypothetical protein BC827DRAFT_1222708 [Russula dissimulans]|nr:hypothetical protein BC827DRAFT_1247979 [Russula dissimulans]KAH9957966.1 hypothetical protein BC827DRAFT_1222708 [Russula dissimulans]